ncbi:MAG TPA: HIT family protein [Ignavibacteriaceae bacterium]|nr:HIT family protein [Ignavibacteriaceae bacterium]HRQ53062.1 HIT family protein [Ignavibacteriaceae bacterium]
MDCIFCDIASKISEAEIIFENEKVIAFLDINPVNYGHTLVIPKKHFDNFLTMPNDELAELTKLTQYIAGSVKRALKADGFNIISNNGSSAGQSVFHFHYHIIPRYENDFIMRPRTIEYKENEITLYSEKIKESISKYESLLNG